MEDGMGDRSFLRVGAGAAVAGAVLALVGNLLHPRYNVDDVVKFRRMAGSKLLVGADLVLLVALALVVAGLVAIAASLEEGRSSGLARLGRLASTVGGAIALAELGVETFGLIQSAKIFASAPRIDQAGAFWATSAVDHLNTALFATWVIVLLGLGPLLISLAMLSSRRYPAWLGGAGALGGLICVFVGVFYLLRSDQTPANIPFYVGSLLDTIWLFVAGTLLWRPTPPEDGTPPAEEAAAAAA